MKRSDPAPHAAAEIERPTTVTPVQCGDEMVRTAAPVEVASAADDAAPVSGEVLWTLSKENGVAEARRGLTPSGHELELRIWTGARLDGQEDLFWSQVFQSEELLLAAAGAKKKQLESVGWAEDLEAFPL